MNYILFRSISHGTPDNNEVVLAYFSIMFYSDYHLNKYIPQTGYISGPIMLQKSLLLMKYKCIITIFCNAVVKMLSGMLIS